MQVRATAGRFSLTWRKDLLWIAGFDVTCWYVMHNYDCPSSDCCTCRLFGVIAFTGGESPRWRGGDNSIPSCTWSGGDQGTIWPYTHHLLRAIFVLSWITYQRNCLCRAHHCTHTRMLYVYYAFARAVCVSGCSSYDRCAIVTRAVFLGFLLLELIVDTILMFVW